MKKLFACATLFYLSINVFAQNGYQVSPAGVRYKIFISHNTAKIEPKDIVSLTYAMRTLKDSLIATQATNLQVDPPRYKGDFVDGLTMLSEGDSASFILPVDSMFKGMSSLPAPFKKGTDVKLDVKIYKFYTMNQFQAMQQQMATKQSATDDSLINDYIRKNNLGTAQKTQSGLYYIITQQGTGAKPQQGQTVNVNYTGKLLDGKIFDSSLNPGRTPLQFPVGTGKVIRGWDEGIGLLSAGSKATLLIPSSLGYGPKGYANAIPPNAVLVFDVELISIEKPHSPAADDSLIQDYLKKNQITNAQKTADGLYIVVTSQGTGAKPTNGQTVTVNYTGKLLNGKVFDSSLNPGRTPFQFPLGKGNVIQGWDEGIGMINVGSKATLLIPSKLGYGEQGQGSIPANSVLIFDVELLNAK